MNYIFKGSLCGNLYDNQNEPLSGVEVMLYQRLQAEKRIAAFFTNIKETFHIVTKEEARLRNGLLIAAVKTDEHGNFEFMLDEKFKNAAFDIDSTCGSKPSGEAVQIHLSSVEPQWQPDIGQSDYLFNWEYCVAEKWWRLIRRFIFDV